MLADSYILPECVVKPASFGGLMTLYEANYIKLSQLVPFIGERHGVAVSKVEGDCDLHLWVEEQTRYTCELRLTYLFEMDDGCVADPDLVARVYYDARMAEVRSWINHDHRHSVLRSLEARFGGELNQRWTRNMMLSKWLDYLIDQGHSFPTD